MAETTTITQSSIPATTTFAEKYGSNIGDNKIVKLASGIGGAIAGGFLGKAIGKNKSTGIDNPLATGLGALIGGVVAYKVIPEITTDVQRGNQYIDQQVLDGKSEGNLWDRFKSVSTNLLNFGGQTNTPSVTTTAEDIIDV